LSSRRYFAADCRGAIDVDTGVVTAVSKNGAVQAEAALAELKHA
jgi:hypothetical protein